MHSLFSFSAMPTHCCRKVDILLLPIDHTESIVTVGFHVTTAIMFITNTVYRYMLKRSMNSCIAHFRHTQNNKDVFYIK